MEILIEIKNSEGETMFMEVVDSFEKAEEALGRAERYVNKKEAEALSTNEEF